VEVRRRFDPQGTFLNGHTRAPFGQQCAHIVLTFCGVCSRIEGNTTGADPLTAMKERMLMSVSVSAKSSNINIRVAPEQRALIDRAAQSVGKSRTEFILDVATREAEDTLLDQRLFVLDDERWALFVARLDAPPNPNSALPALLNTPAPWE